MTLRGDVSNIPLSNILQALLLNGQEGVLKIESPTIRRRIKVLQIGMRPLNFHKDKPDLLREVVLKQKILTDSQFQNILSTWIPGEIRAGEFLLSRRILTPALVQNEIRHQLENVLFDMMLTPGIKYEFTADEDSDAYEIFDPDGAGEELIYNVNSVLMESMRREDEWSRIQQELPSGSEVLVPRNGKSLTRKDLSVPPHVLKELKSLLNGENTLNNVVQKSTLSTFEVYEAVFQFKSLGLVEHLSLERKKALADKLRRSLQTVEAADVYRSILKEEPDNGETRKKLISLLEKLKGTKTELVEHYVFLAEASKAEDSAGSRSYLEKASQIAPQDLRVMSMLFDIHQAAGNQKESLAVVKSVLAVARSGQEKQAAVELAYRLANCFPQEALLFHELANIHLEAKDVDAAVDCLKTVAQIYEKRKDYQKLRKTLERISRLKPSESYRLKRLVTLGRTMRPSGRSIARSLALIAVIGGVLGAALFLAGNEYLSRKLYAQAVTESDLHIKAEPPELERAKQTMKDYLAAFPLSMKIKSAEARLRNIEKREREVNAERRKEIETSRIEAGSDFARARKKVEAGDYLGAWQILARLDFTLLDRKQAEEARILHRSMWTYFDEANKLKEKARAAEQAGDHAEAYENLRRLLIQYPYYPTAEEIQLPLEMGSTPPGAEVFVEEKAVGRTPVVIKVSPGKVPHITLKKHGYADYELGGLSALAARLDPFEGHKVNVGLVKTALWQFDAGAPIEGFPCVVGNNVWVGTRGGKIFSLAQADKSQRREFHIPRGMDFAGGLQRWNNVVYFGSFDGMLYALDVQTLSQAHPPIPVTEERMPIKEAPSVASERGTVVVNADSRAVVGVSLTTGQTIWEESAAGKGYLGQPQAHQGKVYVPTRMGEIHVIQQDSGKRVFTIPVGSALEHAGRIARGLYIVASPDGTVSAMNLETGRLEWSRKTGERTSGSPTVDTETVVVPTRAGNLFCFSTFGELKWTHEMGNRVYSETEGVLSRNRLFIGTRNGTILAIDLRTGQSIWRFESQGFHSREPRGILSRGVVAGGSLFIGSEDHILYRLSVD